MPRKELQVKNSSRAIADALRARLLVTSAQKLLPLAELAKAKLAVEKNASKLKKPEDLLREGSEPIFALYASVQQLVSFCSELLIQLPELRTFNKQLEKAFDDYMPGYPPMSPITTSYFAMWTLCDFRINGGSETLACILTELGSFFGLSADCLDLVRRLADSRMGIYEHCGTRDGTILLRELMTDREILFAGKSGYSGEEGEIWFVRAVSPPTDRIRYWVGLGTPHILRAPQVNEWISFFERNGIRNNEVGFERRLEQFLKFGPEPRYWNEFIFEAYSGHNSGALFLVGLPDVPESRPHSSSFNPLKGLAANSS